MSTFDAGSIESRLIVDRSAFSRELREARAEADAFERDGISLSIDIESISEEIARVKEQIRDLSRESADITVLFHANTAAVYNRIYELQRERVNITVDFDTSGVDHIAQQIRSLDGERIRVDVELVGMAAETARLQAFLERYDGFVLNIDVDVDGGPALASLIALIETLDSQKVNLKVDVDGSPSLIALMTFIQQVDGRTLDLNVNVDPSPSLVALATLVERLDGRTLDMNVNVDPSPSLVGLVTLLETIDGKTIDIRVDIDAAGGVGVLMALSTIVEALDGREIDIQVDADTGVAQAQLAALGGQALFAFGSVSLLKVALFLLVALSPIVVAAVAGIAAALVGLVGGLVAAIGVLVVFGAAIGGAIYAYTQMDEAARKAAGPVGRFTEALETLKDTVKTFLDQTQEFSFDVMTAGLKIVNDMMRAALPIFLAVAPVIEALLADLAGFVASPEFERIITFFSTVGVQAFDAIMRTIGNLIVFFGRLFEAFGPFIEEFTGGLESMTAGWAEWADGLAANPGFQDFLNFVRETGPQVIDFLVAMFDALVNIGIGLAPLAGPMLDGLTGFFNLIAAIPPELITGIAIAIGAVALATWGWNAALAVFALLTSPIGIIIAIIAVLVAAIIHLWQNHEEFRNFVIEAWAAIKDAAAKAWDWLKGLPAWFAEAWATIKGNLSELKAQWDADWQAIKDKVSAVKDWFAGIPAWFQEQWETIKGNVRELKQQFLDDWQAIKDKTNEIVQSVVDFVKQRIENLKTNVGAIMDAIVDFFKTRWENLKINTTAIWDFFTEFIPRKIGEVKTAISTKMDEIKAKMSEVWTQVKTRISEAWDDFYSTVSGKIGEIVTRVGQLPGEAVSALSSLGSSLSTTASNAWESFKTGASGKITEFITLVGSIPGKITGALGDLSGLLTGVGRSIVQGLINGVEAMIGSLKAKFNSITSMIPDWKGPAERDATLLAPAGKLIMGGLIKSIEQETTPLYRTLTGITEGIGTFSADMGASSGTLGQPPRPRSPEESPMTAADADRLIEALDRQTEAIERAISNSVEDAVVAKRSGR